MKISELLSQLADNLTDEQKALPARLADTDGNHYEIDAMYVITASSNKMLPEGQVIFASFGTTSEEESEDD